VVRNGRIVDIGTEEGSLQTVDNVVGLVFLTKCNQGVKYEQENHDSETTRACVVRNGRIVDIGTEEIVIGDIIRVTDVSSRRFYLRRAIPL
jgi:magnesium-transporting ATPase (P-type)